MDVNSQYGAPSPMVRKMRDGVCVCVSVSEWEGERVCVRERERVYASERERDKNRDAQKEFYVQKYKILRIQKSAKFSSGRHICHE